MSVLLKALEKSEEDKQPDGSSQEAAPAGSSAGSGFKLAGGAGASKLGSALAAKAGAKEAGKADRVVAAYQEEGVPQEEDAVESAARSSQFKNVAVIAVLAVVVAGGWIAFQEFGSQVFPPDATAQQGGGTAAADSGVAAEQEFDDVVLLPLSEPIYDVQEDILQAALNDGGGSASVAEEEDIAERVRGVVSGIIEDQIEKRREEAQQVRAELVVGKSEEETLEEEVSKVIEEFDASTAKTVSTTQDMIAQLDQLGATPLVSEDAKEFVKPAGYDLAALAAEGGAANAGANAEAEKVVPAVFSVAKTQAGLGEVLDEGSASYRAGDLNNAEKAFRTVVAAEPRNVSALIGLAKVHQARGNLRLAVATLLKASEYAPNNPVVVSELIALQSATANPLIGESRLLALLSDAQDAEIESRLLFMLGNLYAKQDQWLEAKSAFLSAHRVNGADPDIAYNLAVIFDYLNEKDEAVAMYQQALSAAVASPSSFDHAVARARVDQLLGN